MVAANGIHFSILATNELDVMTQSAIKSTGFNHALILH
jgi:hypothetical protein